MIFSLFFFAEKVSMFVHAVLIFHGLTSDFLQFTSFL